MKWIRRQRFIMDFTLAAMGRRKGKIAATGAVYAWMVFLVASVSFFGGAIRREAVAVLRDAPEMIVQKMAAGRHELVPDGYAEKIRAIRGVQSVQKRLWGYYYHPAARANYTVMTRPASPLTGDAAVVGGGVLRTWGELTEGRMYFRTADGDTVKLRVEGVLSTESELLAADLILVPEAHFRRIGGVAEGFSTDLAVQIRNPLESRTIAGKIVAALPDCRPILREEMARTYDTLFDWRSGYMIVLMSGAVFAFLILAWDKAMGLGGQEPAEIGILKAVGWDTADVLLMKFWEGLFISLVSFCVGTVAAYLHVHLASAPLFAHALKGWATLYPDFTLRPVVDLYQLAVLFHFTVVPYTLITIFPAWRMATTDPHEIMRRG